MTAEATKASFINHNMTLVSLHLKFFKVLCVSSLTLYEERMNRSQSEIEIIWISYRLPDLDAKQTTGHIY